MKRKHQSNTEEQTATARSNNRVAMKRKRQSNAEEQIAARRCQAVTKEHNDDMTNVINWSMKEAKPFLHRTQDTANTPHKHRAFVCIICDCFIIGTKTIHKLKKEEISAHSKRLSVKSYKKYYDTTLKPEVAKQYQMNVDGLKGILLLPWARKYCNGYATCSVCYRGMQPQMATKKTPPKFSIANGFGIGSFPQEIQFSNKDGERVTSKIEDYELPDLLKAMVAPVRPCGFFLPILEVPRNCCEGITSFLRWIKVVSGG
jgi:hypothetical protein